MVRASHSCGLNLSASVYSLAVVKSGSMNVDLSIWDKLTRVVIFLLLAAAIVVVAVWYLPLIKENERKRSEVLRLDAQIQKEEETARQLKESTRVLREDTNAIGRLVREQLILAKPDETVIYFEPATTNTPSSR